MVIVEPFLLLSAILPCSSDCFDRFGPLANAFEAMILSADAHNTCPWIKMLSNNPNGNQHLIETASPPALIFSGLLPGKPTQIHILGMTTCCYASSSAAWLFFNKLSDFKQRK